MTSFLGIPVPKYAIGDVVGIWCEGHQGGMTKGKVVHMFALPNYMRRQYVVEVPTPIDPLLYVRDAFCMRPWRDELGEE